MVASLTAGSGGRVRARVRSALARRPEGLVYVVAAMAAVALVVVHLTGHDHGVGGHPAGHGTPGATGMLIESWAGWMLMVMAMMLPVIAPQARHVALRSLWSRRYRSMVGYLATYVAVWAALGIVLLLTLHSAGLAGLADPPAGVLVATLLVAAGWQTSRPRRRVMRRCGVLRLRAPRGWSADRDCARAGLRAGLQCVVTCGPVMVAMAVGHRHLILMAALMVLLLTERARGPNPVRRAGRALEAWWLVGFAAVAGFVATI